MPLETPNPEHLYLLLALRPEETVMSFGTDWVLEPSNPMSSPADAFNYPGALIHSADGTFIVCRQNAGGFIDLAVCRLDEPAICTEMGLPTASFADASWEMKLVNADTELNRVLASKLETAP